MRPVTIRLVGALAIASLLSLPACKPDGSTPQRILLVTVDTLRPDHMGIYGYSRRTTPELDRFFSEGVVFERAYATSSFTSASMISVLSGLLPQQHRVRLFDQPVGEDIELVTDFLAPQFQTVGVVSNGVLSDAGIGLASRFDHYDEAMNWISGRLQRTAAETTDAAISWLEARFDPGRPLFLWVHYMDPHTPYEAPGKWQNRFDRTLEGDRAPKHEVEYQHEGEAAISLRMIDDYDHEIAYTDHEIGRLLERYDAIAGLENSLVILTADHGETLAERKAMGFQHATAVFEEQVRVPLMLWMRGIEPRRVETPVSGIDVLPTMLAFAGEKRPVGLDGIDLLDESSLGAPRVVFAESLCGPFSTQRRAAIGPRYKWVALLRRASPEATRRLFFDLEKDPGERSALMWPPNQEPGRRLLKLIESDPDPGGWPQQPRRGTLRKQNPRLLELLGYMDD